MATLQQALTRIDAICPNAWDETAKLLWLNECESMIQTRILGVAPEQCITYDADTDRSTALLVPARRLTGCTCTTSSPCATTPHTKRRTTPTA